jgi:methoxymalonate biosynthesis protein
VIKCVVWDLDNTLLDGIYLESPDRPPAASPGLTRILTELAGRGILHAIASRNPAEAGQYAERATGHAFAAIDCGWGTKSAAIRAIASELGVAADAIAFVDDDVMERAEVSFRLPDVLVLAPEDMADAVGWPQFSPPVVTDEARRRGELYLQRRSRQEEARAFGGSPEEFLRYCQTRVTISPATPADLPRLHELSVRTHQFNSIGRALSDDDFARLLRPPGRQAFTVRLADRFGDDGIVGGCVIVVGPGQAGTGRRPSWDVPLLMMSCRALGRGVIDAQLTWICQAARAGGAGQVTLTCLVSPRNVPLRIALTGAGFRAAAPDGPAGAPRFARYVRSLVDPLPDLPGWVTVTS